MRLGNVDFILLADLVNFSASDFKCLLVEAHALDADRGFLVAAVSDGPLDDTEVDTFFFAGIETQIEGLSVEQVPLQADSETLKTRAFGSVALGSYSLVSFSQHLNIGVVRCQLTVRRNDCA